MKRITFSLAALLLASSMFAQDYIIKEQVPTVAIGFQPLSFTYNAAEIDFDLRLSPRNWLTIAPRLQFGNPTYTDYFYDPTDAIDQGVGLGLTYRYYPITPHTRKANDGIGPFVSAGMDYLQTDYSYLGRQYVPYTDVWGNTQFTVNNEHRYDQTVSNLGLSVNIGYTWRLFDIMYMEAFLGVGVKMSDYVYDSERNFNLGKNYWDTGYSGYFVSNGFRLGVYLNRYKYIMK